MRFILDVAAKTLQDSWLGDPKFKPGKVVEPTRRNSR